MNNTDTDTDTATDLDFDQPTVIHVRQDDGSWRVLCGAPEDLTEIYANYRTKAIAPSELTFVDRLKRGLASVRRRLARGTEH